MQSMTTRRGQITRIMWSAVTTGGLVAGTTATVLQLLGMTGVWTTMVFVLILVFFSLSAFNVMLYRETSALEPVSRYIEGYDAVFDALTASVVSATDSIWVTRFSRSTVDRSHEYFRATERRIKGISSPPVHNYRRLLSVTTADKAAFVCEMLESYWDSRNFTLRSTDNELNFEMLIVDHTVAYLMFHDPGASNSVINSALRVSDREVVNKLRAVYDAIWISSTAIKDEPVLNEAKRQRLLSEFAALGETLPY